MKEVRYTRQAAKTLRRMPRNEADRIRGKVDLYAKDPSALANNVKPLQGSAYIRLRVGDWRVIMHDTDVIDVLKVGARGDIYD